MSTECSHEFATPIYRRQRADWITVRYECPACKHRFSKREMFTPTRETSIRVAEVAHLGRVVAVRKHTIA